MTTLPIALRRLEWQPSFACVAGLLGMVSFLLGVHGARVPVVMTVPVTLTVLGGLLIARPRWGRLGVLTLLVALSCIPIASTQVLDAFVLRMALVFALMTADAQVARNERPSSAGALAPLFWGALQVWVALDLSQHAGAQRWLSIPLYLSMGLVLFLSERARPLALVPQALAAVGLIACGQVVSAWLLLGWAMHVVSAPTTSPKERTLDLRTVLGLSVLGLELVLAVGPVLGARAALVPARNLLGLLGLVPPP